MGNLNNSWLSQLAPAHQPEMIGLWPLAIGWWILIALFIIIAVGTYFYFNHSIVKIKDAAKKELKACQTLTNDHEFAVQLESLLRRYALTLFDRENVAKLQGEQWLNFIVAHGGNTFNGESGQHFLKMIYSGKAKAYREDWLNGAKKFIKDA